MKHIRPFLLALSLLLCLALPAWAEQTPATSTDAPVAAKLSAKEQADVNRIEAYLNDLKSVGANFLQVSDSGNLRHGALSIQRPGKMRVVYDAPDKDFIVADGSRLNIWDDEMGQQTTVGLDEGMASFILRENIKLSGDVVVTRFVRFPAKIEVSLVSVKEPHEGELTLIFEDNPLKLRQWRILDPQGRTTGVNLENAREGIEFPENTFVFVSPKLGKNNYNK
ncbi:MAG: outer membrane lipoprotein carrier protein LolA [Bdellovibrionales bacterium]|jgi:outer membrane lipoprotein-sorting protein